MNEDEKRKVLAACKKAFDAMVFDPPRRETYRDALEEARVWLMERYGKSLPMIPPELCMFELLQAALPREEQASLEEVMPGRMADGSNLPQGHSCSRSKCDPDGQWHNVGVPGTSR